MNILGVDYNVRFNKDWSVQDLAMGRADTKKGEIVLAESMSEDLMEATLVHEVVHCHNEMLGIGLDERQITAIATAFNETFGPSICFGNFFPEE